MKKPATQRLTPKLRFPEFRGEEWHQRRLDEVCSAITQGGTPDTSTAEFWNGSVCWITPAEMGKSESPFVETTDRKITEEGLRNCSSVLLPINSVIISTRAPIGHLAINRSPMAINQGCKGLIPSDELDCQFLYFALSSSKSRLNDLGAGNTFKELSAIALKSFSTAFPSLPEQQKIASCLSSLDDLIAAESRKLDTLKAHKKGLMQQLFPREGETVPRLRFPEFRGKAEWTATVLGELSEVVRGGSPRPIDGFLTTSADGLNWLKIGDVDRAAKYVTRTAEKVRSEALSKTRVVNPGDLILSNSMSFGRPYILQITTCIHDGWIAITRISKQTDRGFLYYLISAPGSQGYFVDNAAGSGVQNLNADIIKALPVCFPSLPEQHRIAACLSSLDDLIAAQSARIEALKAHKRGLMQQLFPSPEATGATRATQVSPLRPEEGDA